MEHCTIFQSSVSRLSFRRWVTVNHHNYIRFLRIALIPFIRSHHGSGSYWVWMDLASAHYTNNTLAYLQQRGFIPKLYPQGCKPTMRCLAPAGKRFLASAQKDFLWWRMEGNFAPGTDAENQEGPANSHSNSPLQQSKYTWQCALEMAIRRSMVKHWTKPY